MRLNDFFLNICTRDITNEGIVSICSSKFWEIREYSHLFETSLEADFILFEKVFLGLPSHPPKKSKLVYIPLKNYKVKSLPFIFAPPPLLGVFLAPSLNSEKLGNRNLEVWTIPSTIYYFLVLFIVLLREAALVTWQACGRTWLGRLKNLFAPPVLV